MKLIKSLGELTIQNNAVLFENSLNEIFSKANDLDTIRYTYDKESDHGKLKYITYKRMLKKRNNIFL